MTEEKGSTFKVPLTKIREVLPHSNAERLEIAVVYGFQVIVQKGRYKAGDLALYVPIDSILPLKLEEKIFPPESKVKLNKSRVRQIKLRGLASQGMLLDQSEINEVYGFTPGGVEDDYSTELGITKYEPPQRENTSTQPGIKRGRKRLDNPNFHQYNGLDNIKWYPDKFKPEEEIVLQEKIHGTNARAALMPFIANTLWKKFLKFIGLAPAIEFCYGSNRVQLQNKSTNTGFYGYDLQGQVFEKMGMKDKLKLGESVYGEIYGEGIQKNYDYGSKEPKFILFDVKIMQPDGSHKWLTPDEVKSFAQERGIDIVPELYRGPYKSLDFVKSFAKGDSVFAPSQKVREGVVAKSVAGYDEYGNKRALKIINEDYLADESNTDFH